MAKTKKVTQQKAAPEESISGEDISPEDETEDETEDDSDEMQLTVPEGFVRRNANDSAGWVAKLKGNVVYGMLLGRFSRSDGMNEENNVRHFYQIKLLQPCKLSVREADRSEDGETRDGKKGEVVNLDENKGCEGLQEALKEGGFQVAWVKYLGKAKQAKNPGRKFWQIEVHTQKRNAPF